jgi:hypothetical protein
MQEAFQPQHRPESFRRSLGVIQPNFHGVSLKDEEQFG